MMEKEHGFNDNEGLRGCSGPSRVVEVLPSGASPAQSLF